MALCRVEREMLSKVITDFASQLEEDWAELQERERQQKESKRLLEEERKAAEQVCARQLY